MTASRAHVPADLTDPRFAVEPQRFHEPGYRDRLATMVAHVVALEGPVFEDVLVTRVSRAHGFGRSGGKIRQAMLAALGPRFARSDEDGRIVVWPGDRAGTAAVTFRAGRDGTHDHQDVPLVELAGSAERFRGDEAEVVRAMAGQLRISKLREQTRERLLLAVRGRQRWLGVGLVGPPRRQARTPARPR